MIARPVLPYRPPDLPGRPMCVIAGPRGWAVLLPKTPIHADGDDGDAAALVDRGVAALDRCIGKHQRPTGSIRLGCQPRHVLVEPDQQNPRRFRASFLDF